MEKQNLHNKMKEAAADPMFIEDLESTMNDFSYSDFEADKILSSSTLICHER